MPLADCSHVLLLAQLFKKNKKQTANVQIESSKSCSFLVALCKCSENQVKLAFWEHQLCVSSLFTSLFPVFKLEELVQIPIDCSGESGCSSVQMAVGQTVKSWMEWRTRSLPRINPARSCWKSGAIFVQVSKLQLGYSWGTAGLCACKGPWNWLVYSLRSLRYARKTPTPASAILKFTVL